MRSTMPVLVYGESTPNPNILKFVLNFKLVDGSLEFHSAEEAYSSPLARHLFSFPEIKSLFVSSNFISVTKEKSADWYELMPQIRESITDFFKNGGDVISHSDVQNDADSEAYSAVDNQIINIINEYVRPAVESDGGEIVFKSFTEGTVTLSMKGACRGCPSSAITLKSGIETLLKQMVPGVKEVVAE